MTGTDASDGQTFAATSFAAQRPVVAFLIFWALAALISWTAYIFAIDAPDTFAGRLIDWPGTIAKFGPSLAGLACILALGGAGAGARLVRGLIRTGEAGWLVFAIGFPFVVTLLSVGAEIAAGEGASILGSAQPLSAALALAAVYWIGLRVLLGGGLGEEIGIRGFALPVLLTRLGPRKASVVIGVFWALWHLPALLGQPALIWTAQLFLCVSLSVVFTYVWLRTGGSILVAILLHGAINGWAAFFENAWSLALDDASLWQIARILICAVVAVVLCCLRWRKA